MSLFTRAVKSTNKIDLDKVKILAENFNKLIAKYPIHDHHYINNELDSDNFVYLNDAEMLMIRKEALDGGWTFKCYDDNYNTITYSLSKI